MYDTSNFRLGYYYYYHCYCFSAAAAATTREPQPACMLVYTCRGQGPALASIYPAEALPEPHPYHHPPFTLPLFVSLRVLVFISTNQVPALVWSKSHLPSEAWGTDYDKIMHSTDWLPTFASLAGAELSGRCARRAHDYFCFVYVFGGEDVAEVASWGWRAKFARNVWWEKNNVVEASNVSCAHAWPHLQIVRVASIGPKDTRAWFDQRENGDSSCQNDVASHVNDLTG